MAALIVADDMCGMDAQRAQIVPVNQHSAADAPSRVSSQLTGLCIRGKISPVEKLTSPVSSFRS